MADEWLSTRDSLEWLEYSMISGAATRTISKRCHDGLVHSRAVRFIKHRDVLDDVELPPEFWWAKGEAALTQNWEAGDFETWIDERYHWRAYGVEFLRADIEKIAPRPDEASSNLDDAILRPEGINVLDADYNDPGSAVSEVVSEKKTGGRPISKLWPDWVAELTLYLDEVGLIDESRGYKNQSDVISAVESRLIEKGKDAPDRSTVQPTVRAVIEAHRLSNN